MREETSKCYSDEHVNRVLSSTVPIQNYYMSQPDGEETALMHYFTNDGRHWTVMEDDDIFADACIKYLRKQGVPVFQDLAALYEYQKGLERKGGVSQA